ncbi:hypothetical protein [Mucilaginibacter ginsenosidivorans]|uniref:Outer membrane beta-barrel protein n=1 Tax=Mucilaginibacter ginsenosidivorans TaxID=398053 RepID=A0A5B8UQ43_9SPHI|nr:hypothetical protein [Mucilaginibacter ginsenosidivorans]QEC61124.1 hypothetical protein FRZ54_00520 [Mucilaginibacter ginsenosidivorans]
MKNFIYAILLVICSATGSYAQDNNKLQLSLGYSHGSFSNFSGNNYKVNSNIYDQTFNDTMGKKKSAQLNGFDLSGAYRLSRHLAAKTAFGWYTGSTINGVPGGSYGRDNATKPTFVLVIPNFSDHGKQSYVSVMAGIEYRDFQSLHKLNPFAHLMVGAGFEGSSYDLAGTSHASIYQTDKLKVRQTTLNIDAGAGLDLKLNKNFNLRVIQLDFVPTFPDKKNIQHQGDLRGPFQTSSSPDEQLYVLQTVTTNSTFQANFRFGIGVVFTPNL